MKSTTHSTLSPNRLTGYLGLSAAALVPSESGAVIVYSGAQNISIGQFNSQNLNLDGDAYNDILLKNYVFGGGNYQGLYVNFAPGKVIGFNPGLSYASALAAGTLIDAASTASGPFQASMAYGANNPNAEFNNASGAYLGLAFPIAAVTHYGWVRVTIDNAAGSFVINDWAYEDTPGTGIAAGAVPEPSSLALLASGGLLALRRRRKQAA